MTLNAREVREVREARDERDVEQIVAWLEANVGGKVAHIARQPRWRPVWFADVERDGDTLELCVRGDRTDTPLVFPLEHEMRFQQVAGAAGIPVAKVYGWCDEPASFVMDRVPGHNDFAQATDDQRVAVMNEYMDILARLHALPVDPFVDAGVIRADRPEESGLVGIRRFERIYRNLKRHPDPLLEFCLGWLRRNPPVSHGREAPIVWDSGQFHQRDGRIVALLDLELGHVGDPMMDLAAFRMRDSIVGFGDFHDLYDRYENVTGEPVDLDAIKRHHFAFTLTNQLAFSAALKDPPATSDYMTNMQWCCETNIYAMEALAELYEIELEPVELPAPEVTRAAPAHEHLVRSLRAMESDDEYVRYQLRIAFRLARHLARGDEIAAAVTAADLDDLHQLLGHRAESWQAGDRELEAFVLGDEGRHDVELICLFHRRNARAQMLLGPAGSAMARHIPIQRF